MATENVMLAPCMGWVPDPPHICQVLVSIRLDQESASFCCPSCNAIHIVDPLQAGALKFDMAGSMLGSIEYGGHTIETFSGPIAHRVCAATGTRDPETRKFHKAKVGTQRRVYLADAYASAPPPLPSEATVVEKLDAAIRTDTVREAGLPLEMNRLYKSYLVAVQEMHQDPSLAVPLFREMVSRYPSFAAARTRLAASFLSTGEPREALQHVSFAHSLAPHDAELHYIAGRAQDALGDAESAMHQYRQALRDDPQHARAMACLGAAYRELGEVQIAERWLLTALAELQTQPQSQTPGNERTPSEVAFIFSNLALIYAKVGVWEGAIDCWESCLSLEPEDETYSESLPQAEQYFDLCRRNSNATVSTYTLDELDPTGVAKISFRMATGEVTLERNELVFGSSVRTYARGAPQLTTMVPIAQRQELECRLAICGIEGAYRGGYPLFTFDGEGALAMKDAEFHDAWQLLPPEVAALFHAHCLESNPQWGQP